MNYYGVRFSKDCHPSDLWKTYFTSSYYVTEYRKEHGDPDIVEIRKIFVDDYKRERAIIWETRVLEKIGASTRNDFLNKHNNRAYDHKNPEIEEKRRLSIIKTKNTDEFKKKVSGNNWWSTDKTIYSFVHKDGYTENCTRIELCKKYNLKQDKITLIVNRSEISRKSHRGWMLANTVYKDRSGINKLNFDNTIYVFINDDGTIENCTRHHLYTKYNLQPTKVMLIIQRKRSRHKGWRVHQ
jgi:hypothetical protein